MTRADEVLAYLNGPDDGIKMASHINQMIDPYEHAARRRAEALAARGTALGGYTKADFVVKDSGVREEYDSGLVRDTQDGKPKFELLLPEGLPFEAQFITRIAEHLTKGAGKYGLRNWELANSQEEIARFKSSALRHLIQWLTGDREEDHAAAVVFNLMAAETTQYKLANHE